MRVITTDAMKRGLLTGGGLLAAVTLMVQLSGCAAAQEEGMLTEETLLDRIQVEDLLVRYYVDLTMGTSHDLTEYFTADAVLDVNGTIARGHEEIEAMYDGGESSAGSGGQSHMLLTNPVITVDGNEATAWVIWTGVHNDNIRKAPRLFEQGREYTELVKEDGRWLIQTRYISADSGMPARWDETYEPRTHR